MKLHITSDRPIRIPGSIQVTQNMVSCFSQDGKTYRFTPDMIGEFVRLPSTQNKTLGPAQFSINADASQLLGLCPLVGTFVTAFANFGADKGEPPKWKLQPGGERKPNGRGGWFVTRDRLYYLAILEVLSGDWQGCQMVHILDYLFVDDGNGHADISGRKKGVEQNENFLRVAGFDFMSDVITYSPNILPELETILQSKGAQFLSTVEGGLVVNVLDFPVGMSPSSVTPPTQGYTQPAAPANPLPLQSVQPPQQFVNPGSRPPLETTYPTQPVQPTYPPQSTTSPQPVQAPVQQTYYQQPPVQPQAYTDQLKRDLGYSSEPQVDPEFSQPPTPGGTMPTQPEQYEIPPEFDPLTRDKLPKNPAPPMPPTLPTVPYGNTQAGVVTPFPSQPSAPPQPVKGK